MKTLCISLSLFVIVNTVCGQTAYVDSLKRELSTAKEDSNKVKLLWNISLFYNWSYPDSVLLYSTLELQLAGKLNDRVSQINALALMGYASATKGNYTNGLESTLKALQFSEKLKDSALIAQSFESIGVVYLISGDYQNALNYLFKAKGSEEERALQLHLEFIGEAYLDLGRMDSALFYVQKAYDIGIGEKQYWSRPYFYLGRIFAKKGQLAKALDYYRNGIGIPDLLVNTITGYNGIAGVFEKSGQADSAVYYAKKVVSEERLTSQAIQIVDAASLLTRIYAGKRLIDSAFKYQSIEVAAKDSLFSQEKVREFQNITFGEKVHQQQIEAAALQYKNRLRMYILTGGSLCLFLIAIGLFRNNRNKQKANILLGKQKEQIQNTLSDLKSTQSQLIQSEKMASLGELTAGIAHEIQNPLNFVNNFSDVNTELIDEANQEMDKGNVDEAKIILNDIKENEQKINHHGKRADAIVKGMLQHSRTSTGQKEPTDINALCDEYLRLSYHGMRAKDKSFNAKMETDFDGTIGKINFVPQDIGRVILNLINNAFYAVTEKGRQLAKGLPGFKNLEGLPAYEPTVSVTTKKSENRVFITVSDNGNGIPQNIIDKIFQPFFTTKPTGSGTGLGLSLSYDTVKAHGGEIKVESKEGEGTEFQITLNI